MAHLTYRVEVTRDESRPSVTPSIEITAYIDRVPETDASEFGRLSRAYKGVWKSRLHYTGDFESLSEALAAMETGYPNGRSITNIRTKWHPCIEKGINGHPVKLSSRQPSAATRPPGWLSRSDDKTQSRRYQCDRDAAASRLGVRPRPDPAAAGGASRVEGATQPSRHARAGDRRKGRFRQFPYRRRR